jgi:hypothetical protein
MACVADRRQQARAAVAAVEHHPAVLSVDWLAPTEDPTNAWTLELLIDEGERGVPSAVLRDLAAHDFAVRTVAPRHPYRHVVAIAED